MAIASQEVSPARFSAQLRSRALQTRIMDLILDRGLDVGDAMPTESELSAELGVGRNTVRESLKVLQALGVIEIRHGFGMFVAPNNFSALVSGLTFRGRHRFSRKKSCPVSPPGVPVRPSGTRAEHSEEPCSRS